MIIRENISFEDAVTVTGTDNKEYVLPFVLHLPKGASWEQARTIAKNFYEEIIRQEGAALERQKQEEAKKEEPCSQPA